MFREMRKKEKALTREEMMAVLESGAEGVLATIGEDHYPYAVPLNYACHGGAVYFHCALTGHKLDNIAHNARVSFCVMTGTEVIPKEFSTPLQSVILFGRAEEVSGAEKREGLMALVLKYSKDHVKEGEKYIENASRKTKVIKIVVEHMSGKGKK